MQSARNTSAIASGLLLSVLILLSACANPNEHAASPPPISTAPLQALTPSPHFAVTIPQKALLKNYVTVSVEADPGINCRLTFIPPSGEAQVMDAVAGADGECTWRWKLEESDGKGDGRLIFTIDGISDTHFIEIRENF